MMFEIMDHYNADVFIYVFSFCLLIFAMFSYNGKQRFGRSDLNNW